MEPDWAPCIELQINGESQLQVKDVVDRLLLTDIQLKQVMDTFHREMYCGLSRDEMERKKTSLQMENTYVCSLLNGQDVIVESGDFLALDLGGTNFRVLLCRMSNGDCQSISRNYNVPTNKLYGPAVGVFDHLAESIYLFLKEEGMLDRQIPLGFTFSFPMVQKSLACGILVTWTKSFACPDGVGEDAVKMLREAISRRGDIHVDVKAVLNDTTGTLMAGSFLDKHCGIGLIMGTGCNAAYFEDVTLVEKWTDVKETVHNVVVDIEWGAFGDNGSLDFIKTEFDREIDAHSNHVGSFTFEKLFAGHYIGDLARLVLLKLCNEGLLFGGYISEKLRQWGSFTSEHLSDIERDNESSQVNTWKVLEDLELRSHASSDDVVVVRYLCAALSIRTAQLVAGNIAVLLKHMKRPINNVAIDGSQYRHHPRLHSLLTQWIQYLVPDVQFRLLLAEDGSGRGAAFVAAVAVRLEAEQGDGV